MFSILSRWRQGAVLLVQTRRPSPNARRGFRPLLEALEDRLTPSTLLVTSIADDVNQPGTLRYDVANAQSGDTILLTEAVQSGIVLTQGELTLNQNVTITTADNNQIMISGDGLSRVFEVATGAQVSLSNLILTGGDGVASPTRTDPNDGLGGAILVDSGGTLTVGDSTVSDNSAFIGGGVFNIGTLTVNNSILSGNIAADNGGAILVDPDGAATVSNSTLSANSAGYDGGAIHNAVLGALTVSDSTLSGNSAGFDGGAISNTIQATATVSDSTLSGSSAANGGAIYNALGSTMTVTGSDLFDNTASIDGGAIFNDLGGGRMLAVSNSTLSGNSTGGNGGAIFNSATLTVTGSNLFNNTASIDGGGIFNNSGTVNVDTSTFSANSPDNIVGGYNDLGGNTGLP